MNNKGKKTTVVSLLGTFLILFTFVIWGLGKIDTAELKVAIEVVIGAMVSVGLWFAKDATASHTFDRNAGVGGELPPDDDEQR